MRPLISFAFLLFAGTSFAIEPGRTDLHGDPLPEGAVARLGSVRLRHAGGVRQVVYTPDGMRLISLGEQDNLLRVWSASTGQLIREAKVGETSTGDYAMQFALSSNGQWVATGTRLGFIRLWELESGRL